MERFIGNDPVPTETEEADGDELFTVHREQAIGPSASCNPALCGASLLSSGGGAH